MNPMIQLKHSMLLLCELTLALLALSPTTQAQQCPNRCDSNLNTAEGDSALLNLTTGSANTAIGFEALTNNTTGNNNTATGGAALGFNTTGNQNTAIGFDALFSNTTASDNTATGFQALQNNPILAWACAPGCKLFEEKISPVKLMGPLPFATTLEPICSSVTV